MNRFRAGRRDVRHWEPHRPRMVCRGWS